MRFIRKHPLEIFVLILITLIFLSLNWFDGHDGAQGGGAWELYLLLVVSVAAGAMFISRKWYAILLSLPLIYLTTNLLWPVLNIYHDTNDVWPKNWWISWLLNPWNGVLDWTPGMKWWMWLLFIGGCLAALLDLLSWASLKAADKRDVWVTKWHPKFLDIGRVLIGIAVVVGIFSADWNDGFYHLFGTPADTKPVVRLESIKCDDLKSRFNNHLKTEANVNAKQADSQSQTQDQKDKLELDAKNAAEAVENDRKALLARTDCPIAEPSASLSAVVTGPSTVSFNATKTSGFGLTYQVMTGDPNFPDAVETGKQLPDGTVVANGVSFRYVYTVPGQYDPTLIVKDALGRTSSSTVHLTVK